MKKLPIQIAVTAVLLGFLLAGAGLFSYISFKSGIERMKQSMNERIKSAYELFSFMLEEEKDGLKKVLTVLIRTEALQEHLFKKDREKLMAVSSTLFAELKQNFAISHLYFADPSGTVLLRVHKPGEHGDILNRITYNQAKTGGKMAAGIEMGKYFFSLRAIQAAEYQGQAAGYMEVGIEIDHLFPKAQKLTGNHISMFLSNEFVRKKNIEISGKSVKGFTLLDSTAKDAAAEILSQISEPQLGLKEFVSAELKHGEKHILAGLSPFRDAAGEVVGILMIHHDFSGFISDSFQAFLMNTAAFLALVLILFSGTMAALGKVMKHRLFLPIVSIIGGLSDSSHEVADASAQLASSGIHLTQEIVKLTDNVTKTYSFSSQVTAMTVQNAENASQSDALMKNTVRVVEEAKGHIAELTSSMNEISASGHKTETIVKTIDEVAFQTRLLALNAAVEAARVGDAGAGFAVVANEVKNLSQRASDAARSTAELIEIMLHNIESGSAIVQKVGSSFDEVFAGADKVRTLIGNIALQGADQSKSIEQINSALANMEEVSKTAAAGTEESAAVSEDLSRQAEDLRKHVDSLAMIIGMQNKSGKNRT